MPSGGADDWHNTLSLQFLSASDTLADLSVTEPWLLNRITARSGARPHARLIHRAREVF
jgi:hypothetical protein